MDSIDISLNKYNPIYPATNNVSGAWNNTTYIVSAKYYDELSGIITPKNGYEIMQNALALRAVYWDESSISYKPIKDNNGNDIIHYIPLTSVAGDVLSFTFHEATKVIADLNVQSDLIVDLTVRIKTYTVKTTINRDSSASDLPNNTAVSMSVKTQTNQNVRVNNVAQVAQNFTISNLGKIYYAEHHGYIEYTFDAPEGYMLGNIFVNGINWDESILKASNYQDSYIKMVATKVVGANNFYRYVITMYVNDLLIEGSPNYVVFNDMSDLTVELKIKLITYDIKTLINGNEYDSVIMNNKNTFTDNKTLKVVTPNDTNHYNFLNIAPEVSEGYKITNMNMSIYSEGVFTDIGYAFNVEQSNTLQMINTNLKYVDVLKDNLVLYICYTTEIKKYNVDIFAYAYSIDMWVDQTEGKIGYDSDAGVLNVSALTNGIRTNVTTAYDHEYFSVLTAMAYAKENYIMYSIQEYIGTSKPSDWLASDNWTEVKDGVRGITYGYETKPNGTIEYSFEYSVDDYGDRAFRVVFRQQTTVTINVINPYRVTGTQSGGAKVGNINYKYYPEIIARIGGVEIPNSFDNGTYQVVDTYVYKVNVGSVIVLDLFYDGNMLADMFGIYYMIGDQYIENTEISTTGFEIRAKWDFYLKDKTKLYITYQKETNASSPTAIGGELLFGLDGDDMVSDTNSTVYREATVTQTVTILVEPYENYIFTALKVRQIDQEASRNAGKIVYIQGAGEWLTYNASNFESLDTNGFIITQGMTPAGNTTYTIIMTGNMELSFVFYKTYNIVYSSNYSDVGYVNNITLKDNNINNNLCDELDVVSYDSAFTLIAPQPDPDLYQFMGWYVNGVNVYKYLSTRYPDSNRFTNLFEINGSSMNLTYNNVELDNIIITALYQRIINVSLINELYYYDTATMHWNSWTTGAIRTQYYDYVSTQGLPIAKTIENLNNRTASTISTIIGSSNTTYNLIKDEIGGTPVGNDTYWNTLSTIPAGFDINTIKAYSSSTFFKVLYQNVTNEDYVNDTWENSDIELILTGLPNTVRLQAWQYYNWVSGKYEDIGYSYNDPSGLIDSLGNEIVIDCTNTEYNFNLGYIYSESMPGAINSSTGEVRPLIIRPFLRKVVSVALDKLTYIDYLGGNSETDFTSQVGPSIDGLDIVFPQTNNFYNLGSPYQYISDDNCSAEFDYGAKINIRSYCNIESETGLPLYNTEDENFRFVGWFMNWEVNGIARYRYILDMNGGVNKADENYPIYLAYAFGEEPPEDDTIQYRAVYINQYEHKVYSYNIAGGETYQDAFNGGQYSFKDAPAINRNSLSINTQAISFASYDTSQTGNNRAGITELSYNLEILSDESETHKLEFYIDIGCIYSFNMDMSYINRVANYVSNNQYSTPYGYDPAYDKQHKIKFSDDVANEKEEDYLNALAGNYIFSGVNASNPIDSNIQVSKHLQIDIQYVSQVKLIFKKLMWKAGITLPYNLSNYLLPGNHSLTIWDYYTKFYSGYGDTVNNTPDGTVHTYFRLKPGQYTNFYNDGVFKYVPYGFKDGQGIPLNKLVYYVNTGNNNQTLFNPGVPQYRRHVEIDLTTYIDGGPLLFGDPNYSGDPYSTSNTGEGTSASPYRIFTARQLKNINMFWYYNEFSCVNTLGHATNFKLFNNINLQGLDESSSTTPYTLANGTITEAWMPMCYARDESPNGFDGILEGNNKYVYGLAAYGRAGGNLPDTSDTSNAPDHERYDYTFGYGIFGLIKGGTVKNLKVGNAYIDVASLISGGASTTDKPANVGILAAVIEDATITNITFDENIEIGRYGAYRIYLNAGTGTNGIGILAGLVKNSIITTVVLDVYNSAVSAAQPNISINGENAGGLIGSIIDDYHAVPSLNIGNVASLISNLTIKSTSYKSIQSYPKILINTTGTQKYSGGVIGYMEAQSGIVIGTRVNKTNYVDNFVVFEIGNSSSIYTGGVIGRLKTGTLKDTRILSNGKSKYQIAETGETTILNQDYGGVGGIAGYNSGTITNVTVNRAPGTATPFTYTYTEGILGFFFLYGPIAGGIAGINNVQATPYVDSEDPRNNVIIISGEISGFRSVAGSEVTIYAPYVRKGSIGIVSGAKGGIVGFNKMGALIDDCSFGDSSMAVAGSDKDRYLYVYDENSSNSQNNNDDIFDHSTKNGNVGMVSYLPGNLYVGGIAGASRGAIYNSYVAKREIFVKYYNAIANNPFKWNVFVGGICGGQNFDNDELAMISQPNSYEATKETIVSHPNVYTALQFINYDWNDNNGIMNDEIMKTSLAQRSKIQSCYTSDIILNLGIYIWCDNNDYKAGQADTEAENPQTSEYNYVGERQNVSVGGILGYNNNTTGSSSVNHCYSFGNNFSVKLAAYGATNSSTSQYATNVGYYYYKNTFDIFSLWDDYFTNRIGTNLAVNIKGIVGGKAPDMASVATYCWTYGNFVNNEKLRSTGSLDSIPSDQTGDYEGSNSHHRRIGFIDGEVDPDAIATSGGYFYHAPSKMLDINLDKFWGYEDPGDGITNTLFNRFIMTSIAGFVGWKENPDGRIYRTDAQTGMPMVWHSDLRPDGNADIIKWYTIASFGMGWYALGGDYFAASYTSAVNDFPNFLEAYLVGGQIKYSEQ
ncbi:MAG TPA: hypothetical protein VJ903_01160 [Clostridia bacterium]|nr:hypothetical protein [Clostridia bacterium]